MPATLRAIVAWAAVVLCVLVLSIALAGIEFRPGRPFAGIGAPPGVQEESPFTRVPIVVLLLRIALIACAVLLPVYLIKSLLTKHGRRQLLVDALAFAALLVALGLLSRLAASESGDVVEPEALELGSGPDVMPSPPLDRALEQPPPWLPWVALAVTTVAATAIVARIALSLMRRANRRGGVRTEVAEEAEAAIGLLRAGGDLREVVIRCYSQMQRIVHEARGISRREAATPREFLAELEAAGIPAEPARDLTEVFEEVRYGHLAPGHEGERRALDSLARIASFCRSTS